MNFIQKAMLTATVIFGTKEAATSQNAGAPSDVTIEQLADMHARAAFTAAVTITTAKEMEQKAGPRDYQHFSRAAENATRAFSENMPTTDEERQLLIQTATTGGFKGDPNDIASVLIFVGAQKQGCNPLSVANPVDKMTQHKGSFQDVSTIEPRKDAVPQQEAVLTFNKEAHQNQEFFKYSDRPPEYVREVVEARQALQKAVNNYDCGTSPEIPEKSSRKGVIQRT